MDNSTVSIIESLVYFSIFPVSITMVVGWRKMANTLLGFVVGLVIILVPYFTLTGVYEIMLKILN